VPNTPIKRRKESSRVPRAEGEKSGMPASHPKARNSVTIASAERPAVNCMVSGVS
jgi:hypothetical protein